MSANYILKQTVYLLARKHAAKLGQPARKLSEIPGQGVDRISDTNSRWATGRLPEHCRPLPEPERAVPGPRTDRAHFDGERTPHRRTPSGAPAAALGLVRREVHAHAVAKTERQQQFRANNNNNNKQRNSKRKQLISR